MATIANCETVVFIYSNKFWSEDQENQSKSQYKILNIYDIMSYYEAMVLLIESYLIVIT
jgi:hypothetical protein